jgi:hypothetical protein
MKMPLTRHFYSIDEVTAALTYTSYRNEHKETLFWCKELILSGCISETISTLFQSWLWHKGNMSWLIHAWKLRSEEVSENDIIVSAYQLSTSPQDHSLWNVLLKTVNDPSIPDRVTHRSPEFLSNDPKEMYFIRALYQGKGQCAWWISQYLPSVWSLLEWYIEKNHPLYSYMYKIYFEALMNYEQLLGYKSDEYDIIVRCSAILSVSSLRFNKIIDVPDMDPFYTKLLEKWDCMKTRTTYLQYSYRVSLWHNKTRNYEMVTTKYKRVKLC